MTLKNVGTYLGWVFGILSFLWFNFGLNGEDDDDAIEHDYGDDDEYVAGNDEECL